LLRLKHFVKPDEKRRNTALEAATSELLSLAYCIEALFTYNIFVVLISSWCWFNQLFDHNYHGRPRKYCEV